MVSYFAQTLLTEGLFPVLSCSLFYVQSEHFTFCLGSLLLYGMNIDFPIFRLPALIVFFYLSDSPGFFCPSFSILHYPVFLGSIPHLVPSAYTYTLNQMSLLSSPLLTLSAQHPSLIWFYLRYHIPYLSNSQNLLLLVVLVFHLSCSVSTSILASHQPDSICHNSSLSVSAYHPPVATSRLQPSPLLFQLPIIIPLLSWFHLSQS